jgi:hypothetical protein
MCGSQPSGWAFIDATRAWAYDRRHLWTKART